MARKLEVQIVGDASSLSKAFGKAGKSASGFGKALGQTAKYAGLALGAAGIGGLAVVLKSGIAEFSEAAKVGAQTNAVLKSTGEAAKVTAAEVSGLAEALMRKSGVDDEEIQAGENMLLTFTRIRNEVGKGNDIFNQATKATLDMSVAMGKDMKGSAILVGKALNDPVKGMTALTKAGIQFTDAQKKSIKAMVASGDQMGAQKMILKELNTQFGGSAAAIGSTLPGQLAVLKQSFSNLSAQIVGGLVPAFTAVVAWLTQMLPRMQEFAAAFGERVGPAIATLRGHLAQLVDAGQAMGEWLHKNATLALTFGGAIGGVIVALKIYTAVTKAAAVATAILTAVTLANPFVLAAVAIAALAGALVVLYTRSERVRTIVNAAFAAIKGVVLPIVATLQAAWERFGGSIIKVATTAFRIVATVVRTYLNIVKAIVTAVMAAIRGDWTQAWNALKTAVTTAFSAIRSIITGFRSFAFQAMVAVGRALIDGVLSGASSLGSRLKGALTSQISGAISGVKGAFGIDSPSKVTAKEIGEPLATGITDGFAGGFAQFTPVVKARLQKAIDAAAAVVASARSRFQASFSLLSDKLLRAFDAQTGAHQTKAGAELDLIAQRRQAEDLASAVEAAQARLTEALAGGDPAAIAEAQRALFRAQEDIQMVSLEAQRVTQEQAYTDQRDAQREHLEKRLAMLAAAFTKEGATVKASLKAIDKIMKSFGITFAESGALIGKHFVAGLQAAIGGAAVGAAGVTAAKAGGTVKGQTVVVPLQIDGKTVATAIIDPLRATAKVFENRNARSAFA